jgi:hypothetical protein
VKPKRLLLLISYFSSWIYYKKRGQQSPDRAEALVLAFARPMPRKQPVYLSQRYTISPV